MIERTPTQKVVIVTGASAGIGQACADRLHAGGWTVVGASRRGTASSGWTSLVMDVDDESARAGVESVIREYGRVDAVVHAAGWGLAGSVEDTSIEEARAQLETNFWGAVRVTRAVLPSMRAAGGGRIVHISSIGGVIAIPFQAFYSASKYALEGFAEALAYEVAPFGIDVVLVEPGNVSTDFTANRRMAVAGSDSAYTAAAKRAIGRMERDERNGIPPAAAARTIERVLNMRRPPRRVVVGKPVERLGLVARRALPSRLFERLARRSLGVG